MMKLKCLYAFSHADLDVIEIKRLDISDSEDKSLIYQWLVVDSTSDKVWKLEFKSMDKSEGSESRTFVGASLQFGQKKGLFHFQGKDYEVTRYPSEQVTDSNLKKISQFLYQSRD